MKPTNSLFLGQIYCNCRWAMETHALLGGDNQRIFPSISGYSISLTHIFIRHPHFLFGAASDQFIIIILSIFYSSLCRCVFNKSWKGSALQQQDKFTMVTELDDETRNPGCVIFVHPTKQRLSVSPQKYNDIRKIDRMLCFGKGHSRQRLHCHSVSNSSFIILPLLN